MKKLTKHQSHLDHQGGEGPNLSRSPAPVASSLESSSYAAIFEHAPQILFVVDCDMVVHDVNRKGIAFARCRREELLGRRLGEILVSIPEAGFHEDCALGVKCANCAICVALQDTLTSGNPHFDMEIPSSDRTEPESRERYVIGAISRIQELPVPLALVSLEVCPSQQGTGGSFTDVGFGFRSTFETHHAVMLLIDPVTGSIVDANEAAARFYGYSRGNLKALNIADINLLTPEQITMERLRAVEQERNCFIFPHKLASGEQRTVEVRSTPVTLHDRLLLLSIVHDITEKTQATEQLRETSERLLLATRAAKIGIWDYDVQTRTIAWDPYMYELHGLKMDGDRDLHKVWLDQVHPEDRERIEATMSKALEGTTDLDNEDTLENEFGITWPDGSHHYLRAHARIYRDATGKPVRLIGATWDKTESRNTEATLRDNERRLASIYDAVADSVFLLKVDGDRFMFESVNTAFLTVTGLDRSMVEGKWVDQIIPEPSLQLVLEKYRTAISTRQSVGWEEQSVYPSGTLVGEVTIVPLFTDQGYCTHIVGSVHNITERKQAEKALAQKQTQLHGLTESIPGIIFQFYAREDGNWGLYYISGKTQDILGLPNDFANPLELFSSRLDPRDVARFQESVHTAVANRTPWEFEGRFFRPNGESVWLKGISTPEVRSGEVVFNGILLDVTAQKKIELELSESEERFRLIAEGAFDVIFATDAEHVIQYVSPKVETTFGYRPDELEGKGINAIAPESEHGLLKRAFARVSDGHPVMNKLFHVIKKDGTIADAELNAVPMYRSDRLVGDIAIVRDVSETKRLHDLESRAQRLETAGKIAGQVAHDFNNLLAPIIAYPEFIRESISESNPESNSARNYLSVIETAANKIADINQELLTLSRRGHYTQDVLDLNGLVRQVITDLGTLPETLVCDLELDESLLSIRGGRAQIYRVLMNLIVNARDALRDCGRIGVRTENFYVDTEIVGFGRVPRGEYARLTISDTGCGIPPDVIQRIFDPFFTTKVTDKRRGSGLGLSVVDAVVKDHGGYIDLVTKTGIGTSFFIYFPVTREAKEEPISEECPTGTERILVVDDDDIQRTVTSDLLGRLGYAVTIAASGEAALELMAQESFDLLILDMIMPGGIDGTETYRRALTINSAQRAIIVSGFSETERVHMVQGIGAGDFVRKPLTRQSLARAVRREIDRVPHSQVVKA